MKILEINTEKTWRGGERQTYYNILGMQQQGLELELLCRKRFPLSKKAGELKIPVHQVKGAFDAILFLMKRGRRYDIIHTQTAKAQFYAVLTKWIHCRPVVYTRRVDFVPKGRFTLLKYKLTDKVVAISEAIKIILTDFKVKNIAIISDAVAPKTLHKKRVDQIVQSNHWTGKKIIATTAAFVQHKDPLTMVRTIGELYKIRQDFIFLHFGTGPLAPQVFHEINELKISDCYRIMGFIDDVEDFFSVFDVFTMSSEEEGLGSSVLDAFIYKVPVATTNAGGLKEIVKERGLLSPVHDPVQLAKHIDHLLNDPALGADFTEKAYAYVMQNHSVEKIAKDYKELFEAMIHKHQIS
jgi:glycosyltransferase involved in cell wall biosynthesis